MSAALAVARVDEIQSRIAQLGGKPRTEPAGQTFQAALAQATGPAPAAAPVASAAAVGAVAPLGAAGGATPFAAEIDAAAQRHGVDPALLKGLIRQESNFDPNATSPAGARGLTQLMPGTAAGLGVADPTDPAQAIEGGAKYLRQQLDRFGGDVQKALAAYNAGPGAVAKFGGVPPYAETQAYVQKVSAYAEQYRGAASALPAAPVATAPVAPLPTQPISTSPAAYGIT
jgi:soluble lytic murein transglycosylase-like protein